MSNDGLTAEELQAEMAIALPDKEVVSILDLNVDVDVFLDVASPIDLAVAAQLNVAAPIDAAAGANVLSTNSTADAIVDQGAMVTQNLNAEAIAFSDQDSGIDQADEADPDPVPPPPDGGTGEIGALEGPLLNVDVNVDLDADLAAPIAGAVAANANVAAPISASVAANVLSDTSTATAFSVQDAIIEQNLQGVTHATALQGSDITQGTTQPDAGTTGGATSGGTTGGDSGGTTGGDSGGTTGGDSGGTSGGTAG
jgi:hypothetical protein